LVVDQPPVAIDDCGSIITAYTNDPLQYDSIGIDMITWYYEDRQGNITTQQQTVRVDYPDQSCPSDLSRDNYVDGEDLLILLEPIGTYCYCCFQDINHDGWVNGMDLLILLGSINSSCG
jgi:hypothetical protein